MKRSDSWKYLIIHIVATALISIISTMATIYFIEKHSVHPVHSADPIFTSIKYCPPWVSCR